MPTKKKQIKKKKKSISQTGLAGEKRGVGGKNTPKGRGGA